MNVMIQFPDGELLNMGLIAKITCAHEKVLFHIPNALMSSDSPYAERIVFVPSLDHLTSEEFKSITQEDRNLRAKNVLFGIGKAIGEGHALIRLSEL